MTPLRHAGWVTLPALLAGCSPGYVLRAGWEEAKILRARRPIAEVVHDTAAPGPLRAKLRLVEDAREYARLELGLEPGRSFRSYAELERDTLLLVLSAAPAHRLEWKTWWFPIVGRVPYKGFFDFDAARHEARRLAGEGFDVYLRPSSAFSTLGWLPDPVLSTTLRRDSVGIVETVIHEMTHTTFFPSGHARFNESFANFAGHRGAVEFFCRAVRDERLCAEAEARWEDARALGRFFTGVYGGLEALYVSGAPPDSLAAGKRVILEDATRHFRDEVRPRLRAGAYGELDPGRLNNAWLLARILYYTRLDDFETVWRLCGDLRSAVRAVIEADGEDPWAALDSLLGPG